MTTIKLNNYYPHLTECITLEVSEEIAVTLSTEERIARLMFKQSVEMDMMMNVLAYGMEISDDTLRDLRGHCVQNVKKTNGSVTLEKAVEFQRGG